MSVLLTYSLTNVADVKESLGIASSDSTYNNLIIRKINQATEQIERYCGRRFASTTYTDEEYDATNTNQIVLKQRPITGTPTFSVRDTALNVSTWEVIDTQLYFVDLNAGVVDLLFNAVGRWNRYKFTYTAGYTTIPADLAEACASLAAYYVNNADGSDVGVTKKQEGARSLQYGNAPLTFNAIMEGLGINETLEAYSNLPINADK